MWGDWLPFLSHHRVPGDCIYLGAPRPMGEYAALNASGAKWMGLMDAGISFRPPDNGTLPPHYVDNVISLIGPTVDAMAALGWMDKVRD